MSHLCAGIDAVLVEGTHAPDCWQYIGSERVVCDLENLGFMRGPKK